jgi:NADPH2:quinone reductase
VRALLCRRFGPPESLELAELPAPEPGPGQVVVDVAACGLNFPDLLMIRDQYQFKPPLPFAPGGEVAGTVAAVGAGVDDRARVGERVVAVTGSGGLAEQVVVDAGAVHRVPDGIDLVSAAALLFAYGTVEHALGDRGQVAAGETLLVLGAAGGVGLAGVDIGRLLGARVIAAASSPEKLDLCREHGAAATIEYTAEDLRSRLKELTGGAGVDVCLDPVGGAYSEPALRSMAWRGRYLVVGFAAGDIPRVPLNLPLLKGCSIVGVFWGQFAAREPAAFRAGCERLFGWVGEGVLRPHVSATYPLADAARALAALADRRATGKLVVTMDGDR